MTTEFAEIRVMGNDRIVQEDDQGSFLEVFTYVDAEPEPKRRFKLRLEPME